MITRRVCFTLALLASFGLARAEFLIPVCMSTIGNTRNPEAKYVTETELKAYELNTSLLVMLNACSQQLCGNRIVDQQFGEQCDTSVSVCDKDCTFRYDFCERVVGGLQALAAVMSFVSWVTVGMYAWQTWGKEKCTSLECR